MCAQNCHFPPDTKQKTPVTGEQTYQRQITGQFMSLSGNLKTVSFPDILQLLATGKKAGILECRTSSRQKEVAFRDGNIIFASSGKKL